MTIPNFKAYVQAMNTYFPGIASPWNTTIQTSSLNIKYQSLSSTLKIDITIYQPRLVLPAPLLQRLSPKNVSPPQWEVFISVYHGGMIYDYMIPYNGDQQIAKESANLLKNHGM